jgi:hypothetical protein
MGGTARRIDDGERRVRLGRRHRLAGGSLAAGVAELARSLVALHATDPASVFLAVAARVPGADPSAVERALYDDRTVVRMLGMRRTMFVVPTDMVPIVQAACTRALEDRERRTTARMIEAAGITDDGDAWLRPVEDATVAALAVRGEGTATQLAEDVPELRTQFRYGVGKKWEGLIGVSTRVLALLSASGRIVRGRPRGSWISTQYRWVPADAWIPGGVGDVPTDVARVELVRGWLAAFGPGTVADLKWWTGWTVAEVRRALAGVDTVEVDLDGATGLVLADDVEPVAAAEPWVALLPALDATVMGWKGRGWYLGEYGPALFDRSGNAGPTVWCDGRIVGGWAQRPDGEIALRLFEDVGAEAAAAVDAAADRVRRWLGDVRFTPRFRTPLELELST